MFGSIVTLLIAVIIASAILEAVLEFLFVPWIMKLPVMEDMQVLIVRWLGGLLGVLVCALFGLDLLGYALSILEIVPPFPVAAMWLGIVLTGLLFGRGANWLHNFGQVYFGLDGADFPPFEEE